MNASAPSTAQQLRQDWQAVLAHAPRELLAWHARAIDWQPVAWLREPEFGLAMLRARIGGQGDRFNLGEATITRCVVRCADDSRDTLGVGYVLGRDEERARWIALFDARLQQPAHQARLLAGVIEPLRAAIEQGRRSERARTAASRVNFFTLQPEAAR